MRLRTTVGNYGGSEWLYRRRLSDACEPIGPGDRAEGNQQKSMRPGVGSEGVKDDA